MRDESTFPAFQPSARASRPCHVKNSEATHGTGFCLIFGRDVVRLLELSARICSRPPVRSTHTMVSHRRLLGFVGACVVACGIVAVPLSTRADDDNPPPPHHKQPKSLQQRIIEAEAGIQDAASRPQGPQAFVGPDLSEQEKAEQVLNRMTFGATPGQVEEVIAKGGWQAWAKEQLDPQKIDDSACDKEMARRFPWIKMPILDIKKAYADRKDDKDKSEPSMRKLLPQLVLSRQVLSKRQFKEVMCEFWRNHFCDDEPAPNEEKSRTWTDADYEEQVIRKYCFGSFKDMLFASARHPAMLEYLDNKLSKANAWNENYAREVMELHTLGADQGKNHLDEPLQIPDERQPIAGPGSAGCIGLPADRRRPAKGLLGDHLQPGFHEPPELSREVQDARLLHGERPTGHIGQAGQRRRNLRPHRQDGRGHLQLPRSHRLPRRRRELDGCRRADQPLAILVGSHGRLRRRRQSPRNLPGTL